MPVNPSHRPVTPPIAAADAPPSTPPSPVTPVTLVTPVRPSVAIPSAQPLTPVNVAADVQALGQNLEFSSLQKLSKLGMISPVRAHVRENLSDAQAANHLATNLALGIEKADKAYFSLGKWIQRNQLEKSAQALPALLPADSQLLWSLQRRSPDQLKAVVTEAVAQQLEVAADALKPSQRQMVDAIVKGLQAGMPTSAQLEERLRPLEAAHPAPQQGFIARNVTQARNSENGFAVLQYQPIDRDTRDQQLLDGLTEMGTLMPDMQRPPKLLSDTQVRQFLSAVRPEDASVTAYQQALDQQLQSLDPPERVHMLKSLLAASDQVWVDELSGQLVASDEFSELLGYLFTALHQALPPQAQNQRLENGVVQIDNQHYKDLKEIGAGTFNLACKATGPNGEERVLRTALPQSKDLPPLVQARNELRTLWHLGNKNPHVMSDAGFVLDAPTSGQKNPTVWLVSEGMCCDGKAFWHNNQSWGAEVSSNVRHLLARFQMAQLIDGLHYMHVARGLVHYDLKPPNFLLAPDGTVKVADLGGSRADYQLSDSPQVKSGIQSSKYYAFNVFRLEKYQYGHLSPAEQEQEKARLTANNVKQDVYALGVIFREMVSQKTEAQLDFQPKHAQDVFYQVGRPSERGQGEPLQQLGRFEKLVNAMMHPDPDKRPTLEALARHSLFDEPVLQDPALLALSQELLKPEPPENMLPEQASKYQDLAKIRALNAQLLQAVPHPLD